MDDSTYSGIARLVEGGASLAEVETYIQARNGGTGEDERSAAWLRDWVAWERLERGELIAPARGPDLL
jgi:hypothetical protein